MQGLKVKGTTNSFIIIITPNQDLYSIRDITVSWDRVKSRTGEIYVKTIQLRRPICQISKLYKDINWQYFAQWIKTPVPTKFVFREAWWRHQMEIFSALLALCAGNSPRYWPFVQWITRTKAVTRSFDAFFDLRLNKRLRKQSWGWWSET